MKFLNKKGSVLLFAVVAITVISVLGTGIYFMTTTSTFSGLGANDQNRAYQLAVAGRDYALAKNLTATEGGYFTITSVDKFRLQIGVNNPDEIISTGIVREGTPYEAKRTITITKTGFSSQADLSFAKDIQSFTAPAATKAGLITTDTGTGQISLGKIGVGDEWKRQFGALWYKGGAATGNCKDGRCEFGTGFRAFFVFQINASVAGADGFTFTAFNGDTLTNDFYSVGGHYERGELLGYAGDSRLDSAGTIFLDYNNRNLADCPPPLGCGVDAKGRGIQPPKIAVEFDPYYNGDADACSSDDSRRDGNEESPRRHHVGYVFWGTNDNCSTMTTIGANSYDDNRHKAGDDTTFNQPQNSKRPSDGADLSYYKASALSYNWLTSNVYAYRIEVTRSKEPVDGNYEYTMKSWIKSCADLTCDTYNDTTSFANTKDEYNTGDTANLTRTFKLTEGLHDKFSTFFFGWTMATGGATEEVKIARFRMNFR